jgi:putative transposase
MPSAGCAPFAPIASIESSSSVARHLEHVLRTYRRHYNEHRPHRALQLLPPDDREPTLLNATDRLHRRDLLGGLIHEYEAA